jgi:small-conductance mechanosensitive channel
VLRDRFLGLSAADRAKRTVRWIDELLDRGGSGHVSVQHEPQGNAILIDGALALILTPADADALRGETLAQTTLHAVANLELVIGETREARSRGQLFRAATRSGVATAIALLVLVLVWRIRRWLVLRVARALEHRTKSVPAAEAQILHSLLGLSRWLVRAGSSFVLILLAYQWAAYTFNQFPYTRPWSKELYGFLLGIVRNIGGGILRAVPDAVVALVIFLLARGLIGAAKPFFEGLQLGSRDSSWMEPNAARATRRIFSAAVWVFAAVMAYPYLPGSHSEAFKGMTVLVGLVATLGGSGLFGQVASGIILMYLNTVRVGEYVRIGDQEGTVTEIGAFTTKLRTILGEEVTLPNALVLGTVTKNYSRPVQGRGTLLETGVTIGYDAPWRQVQAMLIEAARRTGSVITEPEPRVFQTALSDFFVEYRLVCQTGRAITAQARAEAMNELHGHVLDVFNEHGVQIMSPHYLGDPAKPKVVPVGAGHTAPARKPPEPSSSGS